MTANSPLDGGDLHEGALPEHYGRSLVRRFGAALPGLEAALDRLVLLYGTRAERILERAVSESSGFFPESRVLRVEVDHAVESEMALHLSDVLERRLRLLLFNPRRGLDLAEEVAERMARRLDWGAGRKRSEIERYRQIAAACFPV
jgi:glycerol-3-phosphate dehydrogenase